MSPEHRNKLEEVRRRTHSALLHRLIQMIDSMPPDDWAVYALTIMTEDNARLREDLMNWEEKVAPRVIRGTFEIKTDIEEL
jgi:hypothetical protein